MTPLQVASVASMLVALSLACLGRGVQHAPRSIAAARRQLYGPGATSTSPGSPRLSESLGSLDASWLGRAVVRSVHDDLAIVGLTAADLVSRVVLSVGLMTLALSSAVVALSAVGLLPPSALWLVGCLAIGLLSGWIMVGDTKSKIEHRRAAVRRASNDFVQLIAVGLTTDQSVEEAIRFALGVGEGEAFAEIRQVLLTAPQRGVPVWEAIESLGIRYDVRELRELAVSVERQGLQGVGIGQSVATLAASMRATALDRLEREADKANANLSGPTIAFVVTTIVFLAYPLAQRISDAFGG
jgi:hypothetical protein